MQVINWQKVFLGSFLCSVAAAVAGLGMVIKNEKQKEK